MDIGRPNNFPRILSLFDENYADIVDVCWGASFSDVETERHIRRIHTETGYTMCPHTAVGHLAMEKFAEDVTESFTRITVGTAPMVIYVLPLSVCQILARAIPECALQHLLILS